MVIKDIIAEIEKICPPALAQSWDNVGLLVGSDTGKASNVLLTIDVTKAVVDEAKKLGCKFIISYHPLIWDGLKKVADGSSGELVYELIKAGISVYSIHTSLDVIEGGVNDGLAKMVGITDAKPIGDWVSMPGRENYKISVFIPVGAVNDVAQAIFAAGAGAIGNYSDCSFRSNGQGTFLPREGASPAIGKRGQLERVDEMKFETIVPAGKILDVVKAMRAVHPYEEPAFDVISLNDVENMFGLGRMGTLDKPAKVSEIIKNIKAATGCKAVGIIGDGKRLIKKAAVCAGVCGKILYQVIGAGCDLYLTGEMKHHEALAAQEAGLTVICLTHSVSERFMLKKLAKTLQKPLKDVKICVSKKDKDPFEWKQV